ncbi:unnamed protein product [Gongylonema pulchrum]|uniref:V-type proton ATPase subunit a n=1 Tax=Gongylonema pulchrum TaxID=637853 RepID=A0A183F0P7_9BILA|nr:unnamed protein product [Gongylonema pulchrum]
MDEALANEHFTDEDRLRFSQRKLDFLEDLGTDIEVLQKHLEYHETLQKNIESVAVANKRSAETLGIGIPMEKKMRAETTSVTYSTPQYYGVVPSVDNGKF